MVTTLPLTEATFVSAETYVIGSPLLAVAVSKKGLFPKVWAASGLKLIVWLAFWTAKVVLTCAAGL
jgi:hypothetical protein